MFSFALSAQESGVRTTKLDSIVVEANVLERTPRKPLRTGYREIERHLPCIRFNDAGIDALGCCLYRGGNGLDKLYENKEVKVR